MPDGRNGFVRLEVRSVETDSDTIPSSVKGLSDWFSWFGNQGRLVACVLSSLIPFIKTMISVVTNLQIEQNKDKLHNQVNQ